MCIRDSCSLREAVVAAAASGDTIVFSSLFNMPQTITLMLGEMAFSKDLTITGTGSNNVIVSANNSGRIFYITGGVTVNMSGMTMRDGNVGAPDPFGGAIKVNGSSLYLIDIYFTNNRAYDQQINYGAGGAVYGSGSTFVFSNIRAVGNNNGAGIIAEFGSSLDIQDSQINQNVGGGMSGDPF